MTDAITKLRKSAQEHGAFNLGIRNLRIGKLVRFAIVHCAYGELETLCVVPTALEVETAVQLMAELQRLRSAQMHERSAA